MYSRAAESITLVCTLVTWVMIQEICFQAVHWLSPRMHLAFLIERFVVAAAIIVIDGYNGWFKHWTYENYVELGVVYCLL